MGVESLWRARLPGALVVRVRVCAVLVSMRAINRATLGVGPAWVARPPRGDQLARHAIYFGRCRLVRSAARPQRAAALRAPSRKQSAWEKKRFLSGLSSARDRARACARQQTVAQPLCIRARVSDSGGGCAADWFRRVSRVHSRRRGGDGMPAIAPSQCRRCGRLFSFFGRGRWRASDSGFGPLPFSRRAPFPGHEHGALRALDCDTTTNQKKKRLCARLCHAYACVHVYIFFFSHCVRARDEATKGDGRKVDADQAGRCDSTATASSAHREASPKGSGSMPSACAALSRMARRSGTGSAEQALAAA